MTKLALLCLTIFVILAITGIVALLRETRNAPYEPGWEPRDGDKQDLFREFVCESQEITAVMESYCGR